MRLWRCLFLPRSSRFAQWLNSKLFCHISFTVCIIKLKIRNDYICESCPTFLFKIFFRLGLWHSVPFYYEQLSDDFFACHRGFLVTLHSYKTQVRSNDTKDRVTVKKSSHLLSKSHHERRSSFVCPGYFRHWHPLPKLPIDGEAR